MWSFHPYSDTYCLRSNWENGSSQVKSDFLKKENRILHLVRQTEMRRKRNRNTQLTQKGGARDLKGERGC